MNSYELYLVNTDALLSKGFFLFQPCGDALEIQPKKRCGQEQKTSASCQICSEQYNECGPRKEEIAAAQLESVLSFSVRTRLSSRVPTCGAT